uniref:NADH:ubiquinone reductase (H(+)-translocating) n=1 Tax=Dirofilaria sp. 'hongkongensis' TaxID=1255173 RepID=A0A1C9JA44_9BILA|nr:NADH dehydrogenase subunit 5 [Dirofilaria sp. 'hongkongensis']AOP18689.1 NADH dehydrogenase subunit 5 [Dirofilaria sp. 'hongkongensis']
MLFVWYILFFYFFLFFVIFFLPYGKWIFSFGFNDFFSFVFVYSFEVCLFFFVLLMVSFMVFIYGSFYMVGVSRLFYFFFFLFLFVLSMGGLIVFSGSIVMTLVFWDFLGVSSFFLVLFYGNVSSRNGAMSTIFTNRIGDFCIFLFFNGFVLFSLGHYSYQFFSSLLVFMLFVSSFVKGGQYPFGGWLPKAMAAPTPVSCLVHSSTLVTAGVMLMDCYLYVSSNSDVLSFVFYIGFFTLVFSGFCALVENDAKKIVALSTMSQIGFCFLAIGSGLHYLSYVHMISHSFFKSLLFMQMGYLIYINMGQQDCRGYSFFNFCSPVLVQLQVFLSVICLCGLLFTSGCCSKEYFMSRFYYDSFGFFLVFFYFLGVFLTFCYCYRMLFLFRVGVSSFDYVGFSSKLFYFSCFFLVVFSVFFTFWWIFGLLSFPLAFNRFEYLAFYFYLFFSYCFYSYFFRYLLLEFKNKFFMDSYSFIIYKLFPNFFYFDCFVMGFNYFSFGFVRFFSFFFFSLFRGFYHVGFLIIFFFLLFFLLF